MEIKSRLHLGDLMKHLGLPMIAAEVGTAEGRWAESLLEMGIEKLYLIDIWESVPFIEGCGSWSQEWHDKNYEEVKEKFKDNSNVILLKGFSYKMAEQIPDESLGLAYIDADHTQNGTKADIEVFYKKVVPGGIIAVHDYGNPEYGVYRAVHNFTGGEGIVELPEHGGLYNMGAYFVKKK